MDDEPKPPSDDGSTSSESEVNGDDIDHLDAPVAEARSLLATTEPGAYYRMISGLARPDATAVLQALPYSTELEYHSPTCVEVEPRPVGRDDVHLFARAAYQEFDEVLLAAFTAPDATHLLNDLHHRIVLDHSNVALITNHGQIIDIALVVAALCLAMTAPDAPFGVLGDTMSIDQMADRSNVLVSRMVTTRQAFGIPAIQVLQHLCRTYLSLPQTSSRRRARIAPELVRANNTVMRHALNRRLDEGGQLLAMAASGSQDISLAANLVQRVRTTWLQRRGEDPGPAASLHLQPLYRGTISLMIEARDVLPVSISLDPAHPACRIGPITRVHDDDDCHRVMEWIAAAHESSTSLTTVYHRHEDPLLVQVREVLRG